ncbi:hypothetical protein JXJ21_25295 [candidate division KSB1 bacterium]|nr:hypothetical protein [candidate division KSB1 bacterium]
MASLKMEGPFRLNAETIDEKVNRISPGNYVIGRRNESGTFLFKRIGRANSDLNSKLKSWVSKTTKPLFKFRYSSSAREAFAVECAIYHDFAKDERVEHPKRPDSTNWRCPRCGFYK